MEDKDLLRWLRSGDKDALEAAIDQYAPYVTTVIRNQLGHAYQAADVEEISSTVFFTLWQKRHLIATPHLRGWLGAVSKNCTRTYLRKQKHSVNTVSIEDIVLVENDSAADLMDTKERARILKMALQELGSPDNDIFIRYYYHGEPISSIAQHLNMHPEAVKSRLRRGREKLKVILRNEGYE